MSEEINLNLVQKLAKIREMVEVLRKNKSGYNYKYVTEDEILARVAAGMKKYGVSLTPSVVPGTLLVSPYHYVKTKNTKSGEQLKEDVNEILVQAEASFIWTDNDNPSEKIIVPWAIVGQQSDASQALGSALTYANRYFMLKFFQIATPDDDPDNWKDKKEEATQEADLAVTRQIVTKIDAHVRGYLDANNNTEEARKILTDTIKKYVRNGNKPSADYVNYLTDPDVANKLLDTLKTTLPIVVDADGKAAAGVACKTKTTAKDGGNE